MPIPEGTDARDLDPTARRELRSLTKETAEIVAQHLVLAGRLMDDDPEQALKHARAARALAGRVGVVREANGLVAYHAGEWTEALSELRTARRITGEPEHLAIMADCERALGRPDRALIVSEDPQAARLDPAARVELMIVASGARRDLGQAAAAVVALQVPALEGPIKPWTVRLRYAYADALLDAGREDDARTWFARAAEIDEQGETDAEDRLLELDGVIFDDAEEDEADSESDASSQLVDLSTIMASSQVSEGERPSAGGKKDAADPRAAAVPVAAVDREEAAEPEPAGAPAQDGQATAATTERAAPPGFTEPYVPPTAHRGTSPVHVPEFLAGVAEPTTPPGQRADQPPVQSPDEDQDDLTLFD